MVRTRPVFAQTVTNVLAFGGTVIEGESATVQQRL